MINVFIGYDEGEKIAFHVLCESIRNKSSVPVSFVPLDLNTTKKIFTRDKAPNQSTDFAFSRFLVPYLSGYKGWSLFMDCDMLMRTDIDILWQHRDSDCAVMVCKHDYTPKTETKFLGQVQTKYEKKNWSSFMLMNCAKCSSLTPDYVNSATGLELHQFKWLESDNLIGELPLEWNWLVGEYEYHQNPKNVHFTEGGPYFEQYKGCDYTIDWFKDYHESNEINLK